MASRFHLFEVVLARSFFPQLSMMDSNSWLCRFRRELSNEYLLLNLASIEPRTSPPKFGRSPSLERPAPPGTRPSRGPGRRRCPPCLRWASCRRRPRASLSWKVRYRTLVWFLSQMIKLYKARSLLYRRQILQENIRWKARDEIYKIYMLLHRLDLNLLAKFRQTFSHFSAKFSSFLLNLFRFWWKLLGISPLLFSVSMFPFSYHSFQTDPQAKYCRKCNLVEHSWNFWSSDEF